jgi:hypothetical protein
MMLMRLHLALVFLGVFGGIWSLCRAQPAPASPPTTVSGGWYTEGDFTPMQRLRVTVVNPLDIERRDCPVVITREEFPVRKLHEMWVTVVDPQLPPKTSFTPEENAFVGGHGIRVETNGHQVFYQLDDLDKDGIWDELFFQTHLKPRERKELYIYLGFSGRGWNPHGTQALIGSYCRHLIAWWESKQVGWKLWYPTSVDMYGKRKGVLMAHEMCSKNLCGYNGVPKTNWDFGSDIMRVSNSFGAGGIGLFEDPTQPSLVSQPRFTPRTEPKISEANFNEDQLTDTRYSFDVVVNGPLRSMIRVRTMNWQSGRGFYELEQDYTAYTNQSYSTCRVRFTRFFPQQPGVDFAAGIKAHKEESGNFVAPGIAIQSGREEAADPDDDTGQRARVIAFVGSALIVADRYQPTYQRAGDNHTFRIPVRPGHSFEYMIAGAWSEGEVYNTAESFRQYVVQTALEYNHPVSTQFGPLETRPKL